MTPGQRAFDPSNPSGWKLGISRFWLIVVVGATVIWMGFWTIAPLVAGADPVPFLLYFGAPWLLGVVVTLAEIYLGIGIWRAVVRRLSGSGCRGDDWP